MNGKAALEDGQETINCAASVKTELASSGVKKGSEAPMAPSELLWREVCKPSVAIMLAAMVRMSFEPTKPAAPR